MMNAISDRMIYIGIYLPGQHAPTTAAIMKLQRANNAETGSFAYGLGYLEKPQAIAFHPDHFPLQRHEFSLEARLVRDGGAMPLVVKDALPDAWGRLVISQELGGRIPPDDELLLLTNDDRVGAMIFSETRNMPAPVQPPRFEIADLAEAVKRLQYDMDLPKPLQRLLKRGGSKRSKRAPCSWRSGAEFAFRRCSPSRSATVRVHSCPNDSTALVRLRTRDAFIFFPRAHCSASPMKQAAGATWSLHAPFGV